jgi:hypothetical protein
VCASAAHRQVCNVLLQVFDEGHLTDGQGRKVDFRNTIMLMTSQSLHHSSHTPHSQLTVYPPPSSHVPPPCCLLSFGRVRSPPLAIRRQPLSLFSALFLCHRFRAVVCVLSYSNLGSALLQPPYDGSDVERLERLMKEAARSHFPPEFINRLDDLVTFRPLTPDVMPRIVDIQLHSVTKLLTDQQVQLDIDEAAKRWLGVQGYDVEYGARPLKRVIYQHLLTPLAKRILAGDIRAHGKVKVTFDPQLDEGLHLSYEPPPPNVDAPPVQPLEPLLEPEDDEELRSTAGQRQSRLTELQKGGPGEYAAPSTGGGSSSVSNSPSSSSSSSHA